MWHKLDLALAVLMAAFAIFEAPYDISKGGAYISSLLLTLLVAGWFWEKWKAA